ncbi:alpha/beta hydrolase [Bradyrhizobium cenepequi]
MFPGGNGDIGLREDDRIDHGDSFVVRTRLLWVKRGYAVLIPDTVDHANLRGERSSAQYAAVILELIEFVRSQVSAPVFLLGTSQGSIAAMNGAAHVPSGSIAGVVLTESVSRLGGSGETAFSSSPENVRVPALVVANRADRCDVAPADAAPQIAGAMTNSPNVRVEYVDGGIVRSRRACGSLTPHGYFGIEEPVVDLVVHRMNDHR